MYDRPARIEVKGKVWTFIASETGRETGTVTFSEGRKLMAKNGVEPDRRQTDPQKDDSGISIKQLVFFHRCGEIR